MVTLSGLLRSNGDPFYIGKGLKRNNKFERIFDHERDAFNDKDTNLHRKFIIKKLIRENKKLQYEIYEFFNTDKEACNLERELISKYGRVDLGTGILVNLTNGGDTLVGFIRSKNLREKDSCVAKEYNKKHPEKGKKHSKFMKEYFNDPDNRKRQSEIIKQSFINDPTLKENQTNKLKENYKKDPTYKEKWRNCSLKTYEEDPKIKDKSLNQ